MIEACIALGSNLGNRRMHLLAALDGMRALGRLCAVSPLFETEPVGFRQQPPFLNAVARLETARPPRRLLEELLAIEARHGRLRRQKDGPRTLDLDLLFYGDQVIREAGLEVPHPRLHERLFVLAPLVAVAPEWRHPVLGRTVRELFETREGEAGVVEWEGAAWAAERINP